MVIVITTTNELFHSTLLLHWPASNMVFCTYCGQSFTRDEHLERHILTRESDTLLVHVFSTLTIPLLLDTNVKPFKCFTCHMSFARR